MLVSINPENYSFKHDLRYYVQITKLQLLLYYILRIAHILTEIIIVSTVSVTSLKIIVRAIL